MSEICGQHGKFRIGVLPCLIQIGQTACRPSVAEIVKSRFAPKGRQEAKLTGQHSKRAIKGAMSATAFAFIHEERRLRALLHSEL